MAKMAKTVQPKEFKIPIELLKSFKADVRQIPDFGPLAGYITFDMAMLTSILRSNDVRVRNELANQLEKFETMGGDLVMMERMTGSMR
jgi:hypothetical protein